MRSKMLGLAVALTTFGLGVTATTLWIAYHTPDAPAREEIVKTRTELVPVPLGTFEMPTAEVDDSAPCSAAKSRTTTRGDGLVLIGGVLNGKAVSKPAPVYPAIALAARVSGTVVVQVKIDECGNVVSAGAISGHPLLRQAAVDSAMKWRFSPTRLSGQPVKVSGELTFNFLLQ